MDWSAARVFMRKNLLIAIRYPTNIIVWGTIPIIWLAPYILLMTAISGPGTSAHFVEVSGFSDFLTFAIIGWFVYRYVDTSIWSVGNNFRWEQFSGTLEPLFVTPVPWISILVGAAFADTIQTTVSAFILLFVCMFLFGITYAVTMILPIIVIMLLMIVGLYGFSFMVAGLIMVFKDPSVLTDLISTSVFTVSPVNYPLQVLPTGARYAAYLIPSTIAIVAVRELAITGLFNPVTFLQSVIFMLVPLLILWGLGVWAFKHAEHWAKERGSMGGF
jgi:ABC-2 type transport system permease protein